MEEGKVRFIYALSLEGTRLWKEGILTLSSGGLRRTDGSLYELATPVSFDPDSNYLNTCQTEEEAFRRQLAEITLGLDQTMQDVNALKDIAWMNYAVNCSTYEMTYQGFQHLIVQLNDISTQLSRVERRLDNKEFINHLELTNKYKNRLESIAGYMEIKSFNASNAFMSVTTSLDEIESYFGRLHNELNVGTGNNQMILESIFSLSGPYAYVVCRYSALFYYENDCYPPNYKKWRETVSKITEAPRVKNKIQYFLRVNSSCSLEDVYIARNRVLFKLGEFVRQIEVDQLYALQHIKEEYLSIDRQLQDKIDQKDYQIIDGHLCIEL